MRVARRQAVSACANLAGYQSPGYSWSTDVSPRDGLQNQPTDLATADKAWVDSYKRRFNLDPDENAFLAYAYADWFVKGLQAVGRNLTTDSAVKALQATSSNHPVFLGPASFKNNHFDPELITVDQARGGTWRSVSPVLK